MSANTVSDIQVSSLIRVQHERLRRQIREDVISVMDESLDNMKEKLNVRLNDLESMMQKSIELCNHFQSEMEKGIARYSALGKRTAKQQSVVAEIPGLTAIITRERITWAVTLHLFRRLASGLLASVGGHDGQRDGNKSTVLSTFLFAVQGKDKKSLYTTTIGKDCSQMHKDIIGHLFWSARRGSLFRISASSGAERGRIMPDWLSIHSIGSARFVMTDPCFGPTDTHGLTVETRSVSDIEWMAQNMTADQLIRAARKEKDLLRGSISSSIAELESYKKEMVSKRRRTNEMESECSRHEEMHDLFHRAVASARTSVINQLTEGRAKSRDSSFKFFGFVLVVLSGIAGVSKDLFKISVPDLSEQEIKWYADKEVLYSVIGDALVMSGDCSPEGKQATDKKNKDALKSLAAKFPSLTCTVEYELRYRKYQNGSTSDVEETTELDSHPERGIEGDTEDAENNDNDIKWRTKKTLSLHKVALEFLYEAVRAKSESYLLRTCRESILAVHALAVSFRGLIRRTLLQDLTNFECALLGEVYLNETSWNPNPGEAPSSLSTACHSGRGNMVPLFVGTEKRLKGKVLRCMNASKKEYAEHAAAIVREGSGRYDNTADHSPTEYIAMSCEEIDEDVDPLP